MFDLRSSVDRAVLRWPSTAARDWVLGFLREVADAPNVLAVVATGSAVRPGVRSADLDLLVLVREPVRKVRPPIEIDLRVFEISKAAADLEAGEDLLTWAARFGAPLHDPDSAWQRLVESMRGRLKLPDPEVADERAGRAEQQLQALRSIGDDAAINEVSVSYLTHLARAALSRAGVFPASRPELPEQLRVIRRQDLADELEAALAERERLTQESAAV